MSRLDTELRRVFGDPLTAPRAVMRIQVGAGQGLDAAQVEADRIVDAGADLVVLDAEGSSAAVLSVFALLLAREPAAVVGQHAGDDWRELVMAVRTGVRAGRPHLGDPHALLETLDTLDNASLVRTAGLLARLAARRTPVLVGGGAAAAAGALLAARIEPGAERLWLAGSAPTQAPARDAWTSLGITPLLDLGLETGGADVAAAVVRAGLDLAGA